MDSKRTSAIQDPYIRIPVRGVSLRLLHPVTGGVALFNIQESWAHIPSWDEHFVFATSSSSGSVSELINVVVRIVTKLEPKELEILLMLQEQAGLEAEMSTSSFDVPSDAIFSGSCWLIYVIRIIHGMYIHYHTVRHSFLD